MYSKKIFEYSPVANQRSDVLDVKKYKNLFEFVDQKKVKKKDAMKSKFYTVKSPASGSPKNIKQNKLLIEQFYAQFNVIK